MRVRTVLAAGPLAGFLLAACVGSESEECPWGDVCAPGKSCHVPSQSCVLPQQVTACEGLTELSACEFDGSGRFFRCRQGVCMEPYCGDGVPDLDEECDDGAGNSDTAPDACRTDCTAPFCGDGIVDSTEGCDDGPENSDGPDEACRTNCQPKRCGDGIIDSGEECDGPALGGMTCADFDFRQGTLSCDAGCDADATACWCLDHDGDDFGPGCTRGEDCDDQAPGITGPCQSNGCPQGWMYIPAGGFEMGCDPGELDGTCEVAEQPRHTVTLSAYCLETTEVRVGAYRACLESGVCTGTPEPTGSGSNWTPAPAGREDLPINGINWDESSEYCQSWMGGGLPTEAQWEKAARGGPGDTRKYPWGASPEPDCTRANFGQCHSTTDPQTWEAGHLSGTAGDSPYGLKDMAGNVAEWVQDYYLDTFYQGCSGGCTDPENVAQAANRVLRGGSFFNAGSSLRVTRRSNYAPDTRMNLIGFRCRRPL